MAGRLDAERAYRAEEPVGRPMESGCDQDRNPVGQLASLAEQIPYLDVIGVDGRANVFVLNDKRDEALVWIGGIERDVAGVVEPARDLVSVHYSRLTGSDAGVEPHCAAVYALKRSSDMALGDFAAQLCVAGPPQE